MIDPSLFADNERERERERERGYLASTSWKKLDPQGFEDGGSLILYTGEFLGFCWQLPK